jgi:uncharacterized protein (DUF736 family)
MPYETRNMSGALFKNDRKTEDRHPDYKGTVRIMEEEFWISAWISESRAGKKYMSLRFQEKTEDNSSPSSPVRTDLDDEVPF